MILDRDAFTVEYDPALTTLEDMYKSITDLGYTPRLAVENRPEVDARVTSGSVPQPIADALTLAATEWKLVFVEFFAEWCIACKVLDQQTLSSAVVQSALEDYVVVEVDTDQFPDSAAYYSVVGMPTLLVLDAAGAEKFRSVGPISAVELSEKLDELHSR